MNKIEKFEDIHVWQKSKELTLLVYKTLHPVKDFGFKDQMQRATVSIMNNIAEGYERKGDRELERFLFIAKASCGEVRSMLYIAQELKYINETQFSKLHDLSVEISKMLSGFIKKLNTQ